MLTHVLLALNTALITHNWDQKVQVVGCDEAASGDMVTCDTVSAVVACNHPMTGVACMLALHQAMLVPTVKNNLMCPMQL